VPLRLVLFLGPRRPRVRPLLLPKKNRGLANGARLNANEQMGYDSCKRNNMYELQVLRWEQHHII